MPHPQKKLQIHRHLSRRAKGFVGEEIATRHLESEGFRIIEKNFNTRFGEIDIIAEKNGTIFFVEVRSTEGFLHPAESLTEKKLKNLWRAIQIYAKKRRVQRFRTLFIGIDMSQNPPRLEKIYDFLEEQW